MLSDCGNDDESSFSNRLERDIAAACRVGGYLVLGAALPGQSFRRAVRLDTRTRCSCKSVAHMNLFRLLKPYLELPEHANIVRPLEIVQRGENAETFVFFDFSPSLDLHGLLRQQKRLRESMAVVYFRQIVSAVAHCHENLVVVRDLKLQKFVFSGDDR